MGFYHVLSASVQGLGVEFVQVEADVSSGLPIFHMVGYLSSEVKEASERVRTAMRNTGYALPAKKVVVNLSPACVKKKGSVFDLPIAVSVLSALQVIPAERFRDAVLIGELGLDGKVQPVNGVLSIVAEAKERGVKICILPEQNRKEGMLIEGVEICGVESLYEVCEWAKGKSGGRNKEDGKNKAPDYETETERVDYSDIQGQEAVKRATLVAVAGNHNLLYIGPPGAGKTMMAKRIPTILPSLTREESLEITRIYSSTGLLKEEHPLITRRPFREVHHTVTKAALVGGGRIPSPGEVTLAHGGVLFLDELAEFPRGVLEVLRQPLEEKCVHLVRQFGAYCFPADFMMVAATNPCPCGYYPNIEKCTCTAAQVQKYFGKISQPFFDRLDICVEAPKVKYEALTGAKDFYSSEEMRRIVERTRNIQKLRFKNSPVRTNSQMGRAELEEFCALDAEERCLLQQAYDVLNLTARSYYKILKVARTIADIDEAKRIELVHLKEAIAYRMIDKKCWGI